MPKVGPNYFPEYGYAGQAEPPLRQEIRTLGDYIKQIDARVKLLESYDKRNPIDSSYDRNR